MSFGKEYTLVYDALYANKDYAGEAEYIKQVLSNSLGEDNPKILEVGMGTGRHAAILLSLLEGSSIVGLEPSSYMADVAHERGLTVVQADAQGGMPTFANGSFDVVLALFHVVSYLTNTEDLKHFLGEVSRCLKPGGVFFFDVWHKPAVLNLGMTLRVRQAQLHDGRHIVRIATPSIDLEKSVATVHYDFFLERDVSGYYTRGSENHNLRFFDSEELVESLNNVGLQLERSYEFMTFEQPSNTSWGVCYVASKPKE